jgi:FixJ family two-component response regulator
MPLQSPVVPVQPTGIALVDGEPTIRRARQLMFLAENFEVRAYATCQALLADPLALRSVCLVADVEMGDVTGLELLRAMRSAGWRGSAILLADKIPVELADAANDGHFQAMLPKALGNKPLLEAVRAAIRQRNVRL